MTDFASKYAFALAESDSDSDGPTFPTRKTTEAAVNPSEASAAQASSLFGGGEGDTFMTGNYAAEDNDTASYFANAPEVAK